MYMKSLTASKEILTSHSEEETIKIGEELARKLKKGDVVALYGEFGAGKTVLVKGIAKGLKCENMAKSPSFVFMNKYEGKIPLYHIDLYRIKKPEDIAALGITDYLEGTGSPDNGICAIEWAEKAGKGLPSEQIEIRFEVIDERTRKLRIKRIYP